MRDDDHTQLNELVPAIVVRLPAILTEVRDALAERHPDYAAFLDDELDGVVAAAAGFADRLVGLASLSPATPGPELESGVEQALFEEIGRQQCRQGRDVTSLLGAYRTGARVAWRHVADAALQVGVPSERFATLAAAVFAAVDQMSAASLRGFAQEQSDSAYARGRLRDELAELLLSDRSDVTAVRAAAERAGWPVPRQAAVILVNPDNDLGRSLLDRLGDGCLRMRRADSLLAIVPDPAGPGQRRRMASTLRGSGAVVGATVPLDRLPASVPFAELAAQLRQAGVLPDDPLFVDEHLDALIVHRDGRLLAALRRRHLAPLARFPEPVRARLTDTLTAWLTHLGNRKAVAAELHVHPQTVQYRMRQLREAFGPALDDPSSRSVLLLALAWGPATVEPDAEHPGGP